MSRISSMSVKARFGGVKGSRRDLAPFGTAPQYSANIVLGRKIGMIIYVCSGRGVRHEGGVKPVPVVGVEFVTTEA